MTTSARRLSALSEPTNSFTLDEALGGSARATAGGRRVSQASAPAEAANDNLLQHGHPRLSSTGSCGLATHPSSIQNLTDCQVIDMPH